MDSITLTDSKWRDECRAVIHDIEKYVSIIPLFREFRNYKIHHWVPNNSGGFSLYHDIPASAYLYSEGPSDYLLWLESEVYKLIGQHTHTEELLVKEMRFVLYMNRDIRDQYWCNKDIMVPTCSTMMMLYQFWARLLVLVKEHANNIDIFMSQDNLSFH